MSYTLNVTVAEGTTTMSAVGRHPVSAGGSLTLMYAYCRQQMSANFAYSCCSILLNFFVSDWCTTIIRFRIVRLLWMYRIFPHIERIGIQGNEFLIHKVRLLCKSTTFILRKICILHGDGRAAQREQEIGRAHV